MYSFLAFLKNTMVKGILCWWMTTKCDSLAMPGSPRRLLRYIGSLLQWSLFFLLECTHHLFQYLSLLLISSASLSALILPLIVSILLFISYSFLLSWLLFSMALGDNWSDVYSYSQLMREFFLPISKEDSDSIASGILRYFHCCSLSKLLSLWGVPFLFKIYF